ncbi:MAG: DUF1553 domain-containing protein, partial [Saprospiraceae bacterium]|nr:DUF1553 domain-containing protein [Saprospiraceae bacterium]
KSHWAFIKPELRSEPTSFNIEWGHNTIDNFILAKVEAIDRRPSKEADKETLLRRVAFDVTGLPPSLNDMNQFLVDQSPGAYESVVDRLLASPQYGERMATDWLDVARFADTHGYTVDRYRDMSPWRDWVIKAFNDNMSYDQFVLWQLAGDLLDAPTREQLIATGFNRNHQQNMEGGIVPEEFRVEYVADRTNTLGTAFMGLTMECARCHDHKFDPISQKEYYQLFGFFNNVNESGQISFNDAMPVPTILLTDQETDETLKFLSGQIEKTKAEMHEIEEASKDELQRWFEQGRSRILHELKGLPDNLVARYRLNSIPFINSMKHSQEAHMEQQFVSTQIIPQLVEGVEKMGLKLDGDAWLDLDQVGVFDRASPFSIGIWVKIPERLENGVLFHKGEGAILYNFRGYHLALKDNRLELMMAHTAPDNAIIEYVNDIPRERWTHLMMTYDGTSSAEGLQLYVDGTEVQTEVATDNLYKDILFGYSTQSEPGLQIGARWRGIGAKGTIVDEIMVFDRQLNSLEVLQTVDPSSLAKMLQKSVDSLSVDEVEALHAFYLQHHVPARKTKLSQLHKLRQEVNEVVDTVQEAMVMREMPQPRATYVLNRGQYDVPLDKVEPGTPVNILPFPDSLSRNRLGLATWLTSPDHPLTARVLVNRIWQQFFGKGLVSTAEDFGSQGSLPTHVELLDWLAVDFQSADWDIKRLVKMIVMSATYRQSSIGEATDRMDDPENLYLSRGPSLRLTAEMVRDNALTASGLLVRKIGGPSVRPYQPEGLYAIQGTTYQQDSGEELYRRSMYTFWKRTIPNPTQSTFDAPTRANCTVRRQKTSTPLQALVLLNDPIYLECAKVIGEQISKSVDASEGIKTAFRKLTGRHPHETEMKILLSLREEELIKFVEYPERRKGLLEIGSYAISGSIDPSQVAANTVVASTILNADATLIKR